MEQETEWRRLGNLPPPNFVSNEELQADLRRSNELLRATEVDRDQWKARADVAEGICRSLKAQLGACRSDRDGIQARLHLADERISGVREGVRAILETLLG